MTEEKKKTERLGFFLSFKKSEENLLSDIKDIKNYSAVIKELMSWYIDNGYKMPSQNNNTTENTLTVTFDDICKLVASVNPAPIQSADIQLNAKQTSDNGSITSEHDENSFKEVQDEILDDDELNAYE